MEEHPLITQSKLLNIFEEKKHEYIYSFSKDINNKVFDFCCEYPYSFDFGLDKDKKDFYIFRVINRDIYKVGISQDVENRRFHIEKNTFFPIETLFIIKHGEDFEDFIKDIFKERNIKGEWFYIHPDDFLYFICKILRYIKREIVEVIKENEKLREQRNLYYNLYYKEKEKLDYIENFIKKNRE